MFLATPDGNHIPPHGPKGAGSKGSEASPEWQVVNRAKRKWASVWPPIANNAMSLEAMTTDPMYTSEVYKSVAVNETSVTGNEGSSEELKNAAPEDGILERSRAIVSTGRTHWYDIQLSTRG